MVKYTIPENELLNVKRILVIQTAFIGDAILSTSIFRGINKLLPEAAIDVLAIPETSNLFLYNPFIKNVYEFDKRRFRSRLKSFFKTLKIIRKTNYDLAISIQSSFTSSILMLLGGIKIRIGYPRQKLLTHSVVLKKGLHLRKRVLELLKPINDFILKVDTELFWSEKEEKKISNIIGNGKLKRIVIAPGSAQFTKQWPEEYFILLIDYLKDFDIKVYLAGGKADKKVCENIEKATNADLVNLAGELSLLESAALINRSDLVISNDSAPAHIANAVKTDVFAIFGPTVKDFGFYPYREGDKILEIELECRPCGKHGGKKCPLGHFKCMLDLKPEIVFNEVRKKIIR